MRNNKKGFTLIEIIVSIMIASIGMIIATTLILNSMGYFNKTTRTDYDKQSLDGIKDYVQNELIFATDIRLDNKYPSEKTDEDYGKWHWIYVKDNMLYRDNNCDVNEPSIKVYNDDFYNRRSLLVTARGFDKYRIDIKFYYKDGISSTDNVDTSISTQNLVYKTATTIELLNVKSNILYTEDAVSPFSVSGNTRNLSNTDDTGYKIYYKNDGYTIQEKEQEKSHGNGTVADQLDCLTEEMLNADKKFIEGKQYNVGDIVEIDGYMYIRVEGNSKVWYKSDITSNAKLSWKKLDEEFSASSAYLIGDVVRYDTKDKNGNIIKTQFYQCINDIVNIGFGANYIPSYQKEYWKEIDESDVRGTSNKKCRVYITSNEAVRDDDIPKEGTVYFSNPSWVNTYYPNNVRVYTAGEYVTDTGTQGSSERQYMWEKVYSDNEIVTPGKANSKGQFTWRDYSLDWKKYNGYKREDIIRFNYSAFEEESKFNDGRPDNFYRAKETITNGKPPSDANGNLNPGWEKVKVSNGTWVVD